MSQGGYSEIPALNISSLKWILSPGSPSMFKHRLSQPEADKQAFALGNAAHTLLFEPEKFDARFFVFDAKRQSKAWDDAKAANEGKTALRTKEVDRAHAMVKALKAHRVASQVLRGGRPEETVTWVDSETGLLCKGRIDYLRPDYQVDVKTTRDPSPKKFERFSANYGYETQAAFYHDGCVAAKLIDGNELPMIVAVRSSDDFDVAVFRMLPETIEHGRARYKAMLRRVAECTAANFWPGVAPDQQYLGLPSWIDEQPEPADEGEDF